VQHISLGIFILSMFGPSKFLGGWRNFRGYQCVIRESQKRFEKPVQTERKPKSTVLQWIRNGFQFSGKGAK
jgi:hypothetical protein